MPDHLIAPHGGELVQLIAGEDRQRMLRNESVDWPSWNLTPRQLFDLELILGGGFSPLRGFMGRDDYASVSESMRLADGTLWPIPITLDLSEEAAGGLDAGSKLALRDPQGVMLAVLTVSDVWRLDPEAHARAAFGTTDRAHPGVAHVFERSNNFAVGGTLEGVQLPQHYDFVNLRHTPARLRKGFARLGWRKIVAFQTRNPMHLAHIEMTLRASREHEASLLIHPVVGTTKPGDVDHYPRARC